MKLIKPSIEKITFHIPEGYDGCDQFIEEVGRVCHKSEDKITPETAPKFVKFLNSVGHTSIFEFSYATVRYVCDRGMSHEAIRHRHTAFAQESTRYCNYSKNKFNNEITVIDQGLNGESLEIWLETIKFSELAYMKLLEMGVKTDLARSVLPIGIKTELVISASFREWMSIFTLRCSKRAHPQIRALMRDTLYVFYCRCPSIFEGLAKKYIPTRLNMRRKLTKVVKDAR